MSSFPLFSFPTSQAWRTCRGKKTKSQVSRQCARGPQCAFVFSFSERLRQADKYCFSARCSSWDLRDTGRPDILHVPLAAIEPCLILSATASDQPVGMHCFSLGRHGTAYSITSFPACAVLGRVLFRSPPIQTSNLVQSPPSEGPLLT